MVKESKIQNRGPTIHVEIFMKKCALSSLVGPRGKVINSLIEETGVLDIRADRQRINKSQWCPIAITGSTKAVKLAKTIIQKRHPSYVMDKKNVWIPKADIAGFASPHGCYAKALRNEPGIEYVGAEQERQRQSWLIPCQD